MEVARERRDSFPKGDGSKVKKCGPDPQLLSMPVFSLLTDFLHPTQHFQNTVLRNKDLILQSSNLYIEPKYTKVKWKKKKKSSPFLFQT